ncbi:MAG: peptide chain release factor 2 [Gemmataceae bacterium]
MNADLRRRVDDLTSRLTQLRDSLDVAGKRALRQQLNDKMGEPTFWDNQEKAKKTIAELKPLNALLKPFDELESAVGDVGALAELAEEDAGLDGELEGELPKAETRFEDFELKAMLSGPQDAANAFLRVQAGAGGTDACDFAEMLLRMYARWAEDHGFKIELQDELRNEEAGIANATVKVVGDYAYGYLQGEEGVHRLVRISPFGSGDTRQTSFVAVEVTPELDDSINIEIRDCDLERQTFRSGGPGGQHQNKTESGVRYIHKPTGVAAESRSERSQFKNDDNALAMLKAKLYKIEMQKRMAEVAKEYNAKGEVSFGSQTRNYVLQPYTLAKDLRTGHETPQVAQVLDGDLEPFMHAYLRMRAERMHKARGGK